MSKIPDAVQVFPAQSVCGSTARRKTTRQTANQQFTTSYWIAAVARNEHQTRWRNKEVPWSRRCAIRVSSQQFIRFQLIQMSTNMRIHSEKKKGSKLANWVSVIHLKLEMLSHTQHINTKCQTQEPKDEHFHFLNKTWGKMTRIAVKKLLWLSWTSRLNRFGSMPLSSLSSLLLPLSHCLENSHPSGRARLPLLLL